MLRLKSASLMLLACLMLAIAASHAHAQPASTSVEKHEEALYRIEVSGIPVGKIRLVWESNPTYYKITFSLKTSGIARLFSKQKRLAELTGKREHGALMPILYQASVTYPHKQRSTSISFEDGRMREIVNLPAYDNPLTHAQRRGAQDPLSALVQLLAFMRQPPELEELFSAEVFDGKRLMRGYAVPHYAPSAKCLLPCRTFALYRKPLAGYDEDELEDYARGEPPLFLRHNPERSHFPLSLSVQSELGTVRAVRQWPKAKE